MKGQRSGRCSRPRALHSEYSGHRDRAGEGNRTARNFAFAFGSEGQWSAKERQRKSSGVVAVAGRRRE